MKNIHYLAREEIQLRELAKTYLTKRNSKMDENTNDNDN